MTNYVETGAMLSPCANYRYSLWREWRGTPHAQWDMWTEDDGSPSLDGAGQQLGEPLSCIFIMLNPSTADGDQDDPTIRRCVGFAQRLGFDRLEVLNLFAWRATNPADLLKVGPDRDPCGPLNQAAFHTVLGRAGLIVCAWGTNGSHIGQDETALGWIESNNDRDAPIVALGLTKHGHPKHPLYLPADAKPIPFAGKAA